jgi:hypothetical protein
MSDGIVEIDTDAMTEHAATLTRIARSLRDIDLSTVRHAGRDEVFGETSWLGEHEADKRLRTFADRWSTELDLFADAAGQESER